MFDLPNPPLPNDQWIASAKMFGWAICFDPADEANFLRKMQANSLRSAWEPRDRLTAEEVVQALEREELRRFWPVLQARLDEIHAALAADRERGKRARRETYGAGEVAVADYVPNVLRCAKCNFELERFTLNANTGTVGIGTNEPARCPNGCGPLWRVTWEQEARYLGQRLNEWADRAIAAEKKLAALGVAVVHAPAQVFTDDEIHAFYEAWEFEEEDPGRLEFHSLVREIERRVLERTRGVTAAPAPSTEAAARKRLDALPDRLRGTVQLQGHDEHPEPTPKDGVPEVHAPSIPATWQHDAGAYAQCSFCLRYTRNPKALSHSSFLCDCGSAEGWSGSFKSPGPDARWLGADGELVPYGETSSQETPTERKDA